VPLPDPPVDIPSDWESDAELRDGRLCRVRPVRPDDAVRLQEFHRQLSPETIFHRFFAPYPTLGRRDAAHFTVVDYVDRVALVALVDDAIIGVTRYELMAGTTAEVAFVVRDDYQGRGLGTILLHRIVAAARDRGIKRFVAEVLPDNRRMLSLIRNSGYPMRTSSEEDVLRVDFDIA